MKIETLGKTDDKTRILITCDNLKEVSELVGLLGMTLGEYLLNEN